MALEVELAMAQVVLAGVTDAHPDLAEWRWDRMTYWVIFAILIALTVLTVAVAVYSNFSNELANVCIALAIAFIKGSFVARYFMHLKFEGKLIWMIFLVPLSLCVLLTVSLVPDVGRGRHTAFNDWVGMFMGTSSGDRAAQGGVSGHD